MKDAAAILDVGKTNLKLLVVDAELRPLARETTATPSVTGPPYRHLDAESIWDWVVATLEKLNRETPVSAIVPTAFGSTAALVNGDALVLPIMDYESVPPPHIAAEYESLAPPFEEVCAPVNPAGLTLARQLLWQSREFPTEFERCTSILPFPQYWAWRLSGVRAAEVSSLGAQTHLWNPHRGDYSSLARNQGWAERMPPSWNAWDTLGTLRPELAARTGVSPECRILCGVHDSNANYVRFLKAGIGDFTLLSTGTWLIGFNGGYAIERLSPDRDTVSNSDVYDRAVACCRFMLGREHALLQDDATGTVRATTNEVGALVAGGTYAMPSFTESGGPFPTTGGRGTIDGPPHALRPCAPRWPPCTLR